MGQSKYALIKLMLKHFLKEFHDVALKEFLDRTPEKSFRYRLVFPMGTLIHTQKYIVNRPFGSLNCEMCISNTEFKGHLILKRRFTYRHFDGRFYSQRNNR